MSDNEEYRQFYEEISKRQLSNNEAFDKAILSLSSAGLALSLTFFKFVVPAEKAEAINIIECAWYLFLSAIICTLLSYFASQRALATELEHAEKYYLEGKERYENKNNPAANITEALNFLAGILFIIALFFVVDFVVKNI